MKCPIDQTEMEAGHLTLDIQWQSGKIGLQNLMNNNIRTIVAWKCPKCGKVELTTEIKEEK